jgi:lipopolysaccharide export system protein LptA
MQACADVARYTPANQILTLTGNPRIANGGMATTANTIRINRANGDAVADGDVKSTYSDVKEDPNGALLASSSPIHVTAQSMTAHNAPALALYKGNARLWQDANVIEAPSIQFDRDRRFVTAAGSPMQPVQTILVQENKVQQSMVRRSAQSDHAQPGTNGTQTTHKTIKESPTPGGVLSPITITSAQVTYADAERRVHYE